METKSDSNEVDSGGGNDEIDKSASEQQSNGCLAKKFSCNGRNGRGMVSQSELSASLDDCQQF